MQNISYLLFGIFIGIIIAFVIVYIYASTLICGTLKTAYDDDEVYLFLDLDKKPENMLQHKIVMMKVDKKPIYKNSQK